MIILQLYATAVALLLCSGLGLTVYGMVADDSRLGYRGVACICTAFAGLVFGLVGVLLAMVWGA